MIRGLYLGATLTVTPPPPEKPAAIRWCLAPRKVRVDADSGWWVGRATVYDWAVYPVHQADLANAPLARSSFAAV